VCAVDRLRVPQRIGRRLGTASAIVVIIAAGVSGPGLGRKAWHSFRHPIVATTADPASRLTQLSGNRYHVWRTAVSAFSAHPIEGIGAGSFEFWWNRHQTNSEFVRNAHSFELENMAELGVPGLVLILLVMGAALFALALLRRHTRRTVSAGAARRDLEHARRVRPLAFVFGGRL
jgi:O-antigen ligase